MSDTKRKLFISQPYTGLTDDEIMETRNRIYEKAKIIFEEDFELIDQYHQPDIPDGKRMHYLGRSIQMMADADIVIFSIDHETAHGCNIEKHCAQIYDMIYYIEIESGLSLPENPKFTNWVTPEAFIEKVWKIEHIKVDLVSKRHDDLKPMVLRYLYSEPFDGNRTVNEFLNERIRPHLKNSGNLFILDPKIPVK